MSIRIAVFLLLGLLAVPARSADDEPVEPPPGQVHLVGHEDTPLLDRVQSVIDDWDPRKLRDPYAETAYRRGVDGAWRAERLLRRPDLNQFIADVAAVEALGKAFFWDMQAGSDFRRLADGSFQGTACASCHYRFGADARNRHTRRIPQVVWDKYERDLRHPLVDEQPQPYDVVQAARETIVDPAQLKTAGGADPSTPLSLIIGSQGVPPWSFASLEHRRGRGLPNWIEERGVKRPVELNGGTRMLPEFAMFVAGQETSGQYFRQVTSRNSPTVVNAVFSDRLFHDGRAESTFNGFSVVGDKDDREVLFLRRADGRLAPTRVAITQAALASQAVGPIVSDVEMSFTDRSFPDVARKLLDSPVLGFQEVACDDSHLGELAARGEAGCASASPLTYRRLIQRAFRRQWWDDRGPDGVRQSVPLHLAPPVGGQPVQGELMAANFSLFWGLSIMMYEATLVSNQSPFDQMLRGNPTGVNQRWERERQRLGPIHLDQLPAEPEKPRPQLVVGSEVFQRGHRLFLNRGCVECHAGPFLSEIFDRDAALERVKPIHHTLERLLLPVSRGDAIGQKLSAARRQMLRDVSEQLVAARPDQARIADSFAVTLDALREEAQGVESTLLAKIAERLHASPFPASLAESLARRIMTFEKLRSTFSGNREFFGEDERVRYAAKLVDAAVPAVQVEFMAIPPRAAAFRPRLPIEGPLAPYAYAFYDLGFYNLGVSPPRYDRGNGGTTDAVERPYAPVVHDLSWLRGLPTWNADPELAHLPPSAQSQERRRSHVLFHSRARFLTQNEEPSGHRKPFLHDNELMFWGAFRTPSLRNVELTAPYMHNGRLVSLSDVIEFYDRGGDVPAHLEQNPDKNPAIVPLNMTDEDQRALEFFLLCLTDANVQHERAPFDHPSLTLVNGYDQNLAERFVRIDAVGAAGRDCPANGFPSDD